MAKLKLMLTDGNRTHTVRRNVDTSTCDSYIDGALDSAVEIASLFNLPGSKFTVTVSEGNDNDEEGQEEDSEPEDSRESA